MTSFRDLFSSHAPDYARYRPGYPGALFDWLAAAARIAAGWPDNEKREVRWDLALRVARRV